MKNYENFRELITKELREEFLKINENFDQQSKVIAQKEAKLRADMEKFLAENAKMLNLAEEMQGITIKIESIEKIIQQLQANPSGGASSEEQKLLAAQIATIRIEIEDLRTYIEEIERLKAMVEEANKLWLFFQKFIDE